LKPLIPLFAFMFTPRNSPVLDAMQTRGRLRTGHVPLPSTAIRGLVRQLQRNAVVWYAPDLAYVSSSAQLVPFFGEPARCTCHLVTRSRSRAPAVMRR
jgi:KDO2-lipid IV(A) palmitoleoyltransferase